jgi:hypothetical protein
MNYREKQWQIKEREKQEKSRISIIFAFVLSPDHLVHLISLLAILLPPRFRFHHSKVISNFSPTSVFDQ